MIPYIDCRIVSRAAWFFIHHAQELLVEKNGTTTIPDQASLNAHLAMIAASIKFASSATQALSSDLERQGLRELFASAHYLAREAALRDPGWKRLGFSEDPVPELDRLARRTATAPYDQSPALEADSSVAA